MCSRCAFLGGLAALAGSPAVALARSGDPQLLEIAQPALQRVSATLWLGRLTPNVWLHTTTHVLSGVGFYPANGAIVVHGNESLLIDTGWSDADATGILGAWERAGRPAITRAVATHFHFDRTGGIRALAARGIRTYGNPLTIGLALDNGLPPPYPLHDLQKAPQRMGGVELFYPGPAHTIDNTVVWIPGDAVLFGGCMLKSTTEDDLGNLGDAVVAEWPASARRVARRYPAARHLIPGHGTTLGNALTHTIALADAAGTGRVL
jgi:glyoxylase-like metal-dependent hydrolase (beta-lactamase superfamily II)